MRLVSLEKARLALRYDDGADDLLGDALDDASNVVLSYVDSGALVDTSGLIPIDTAGAPDVPLAVQRAVIYLAGIFLRDPAGIDKADYADGGMPPVLRALLNPYRTPTVG